MNNKDMKYFEVAKSLSFLSDFTEAQIGAIIVLKNEIIATGYNRNKTHPTQYHFAKLANNPKAILLHAEMSCYIKIMNSNRDFSQARIYTYRQNKIKQLANSKPCDICIIPIKLLGIREIYYTTSDGYCNEFLPI